MTPKLRNSWRLVYTQTSCKFHSSSRWRYSKKPSWFTARLADTSKTRIKVNTQTLTSVLVTGIQTTWSKKYTKCKSWPARTGTVLAEVVKHITKIQGTRPFGQIDVENPFMPRPKRFWIANASYLQWHIKFGFASWPKQDLNQHPTKRFKVYIDRNQFRRHHQRHSETLFAQIGWVQKQNEANQSKRENAINVCDWKSTLCEFHQKIMANG